MECVRKSVATAKENGMSTWIYDEDKWTSGAAGGMVAARDSEKYSAKALTMEMTKEGIGWDDSVLAVFRVKIKNNYIQNIIRVQKEDFELKDEKESFQVFRCEKSGPSEWYNNSSPSDNLNPETVALFIEMTHEKYKKEFYSEFGKTIKGMFTDEPNVADFFSKYTEGRPWLPWTNGFEDYFKQKRGYEIIDVIPFLFFVGEKASKTRHDFWRTISERFSESYSKQIGDWCEQNNLIFTGHFLFENDLGYATRASGSTIPQYRFMHAPGIDILGEQTSEYLTVKQCTSVANQYGRKHVLSETYGCTNWDFTFEGQKWVGDWQYVMGVNLRCQHLALYTLKGLRKRDYPPTFNYNTCWWKYNNVVEDYFARLGVLTSNGRVVRDVLVLHPASTIWMMTGSRMGEDLSTFDNMGWTDSNLVELNAECDKFNQLIHSMLAFHYDLDIGDEIIIEEEGRIENGKFYINQTGYLVIVIPPLKTLFAKTVNLLIEFMDKGGKVIALEPLPGMLEGIKSEEIKKLVNRPDLIIVKEERDLFFALSEVLPRKVSIRNKYGLEAGEFLHMQRDLPDGNLLFVVNNWTSRLKSIHYL